MAHMGVPWAVGGGAVNEEDLGRMLPYFMFGGGEGILSSADCQVKQLAVAGSSVRVSPGGYNIRARGLGQQYEAYLGKVREDDVIPISPTAGSSRSDLVIIRVEDPHVAGEPWANPTNPAIGPYVFSRVIENVPSTTSRITQLGNNFSAITLARIDIPPSTGTITQAMIKDLRSLINPVSGPQPPPTIIIVEDDDCDDNSQQFWTDGKAGGTNQSLTNALSSTWHTFPNAANWNVPIPSWATGVDFFCCMSGLNYGEDVWGQMRLSVNHGTVLSRGYQYDMNYHGGPGPEATPLIIADTLALPSTVRGKVKNFKVQTQLLAGSPTHQGQLLWHGGSSAYIQLNFKRNPILT